MGKSVLFVCLGNICRSPIAEAVFSNIIQERGIQDQWKVDSAAIGGWHSGNPPDSRATKTLKDHNIPYNGRARQEQLGLGFVYEMIKLKRLIQDPNIQEQLMLKNYDDEGVFEEEEFSEGEEFVC